MADLFSIATMRTHQSELTMFKVIRIDMLRGYTNTTAANEAEGL